MTETKELAFYPGCTAHSTGLEYSLSLHAVFDALGIKLSEVDDWNCCGGAAAHSMSHLLGLALPARNIAKAQDRDLPLAIPCPGCFNAVRKAQHAMENDPELKAELESVVGFQYRGGLAVKALHEVILDYVGLDELKKCVKRPLSGLRVVSYYGCALVRDPKVVRMGDHENPTFLDAIMAALGAEAVDWSYKVDCCGADLGMTHGKMVVDIVSRIMGMAGEAKADCAATCCGLCQINLDMRQTGEKRSRIPVLYLTELIGIALDLPGRKKWWSKHIVDPGPMLQAKGLE